MTIQDFDSMHALWKKVGLNLAEMNLEKKYTDQIIKLNPLSNFVAIEKKKIIGTIFGTFNGKRGWIYHLAVHPLFQKQGVGSLLLQKVEQALKSLGAKRILLGVVKLNLKALNFYKKHDYEVVNDAIWMGKDV